MKELHFFTWQDPIIEVRLQNEERSAITHILMVFVHFLDGLEDFNSSHQLLTKRQIWDPNQVYQLHQDLKKTLSLSFFHEKKTPISESNYNDVVKPSHLR